MGFSFVTGGGLLFWQAAGLSFMAGFVDMIRNKRVVFFSGCR